MQTSEQPWGHLSQSFPGRGRPPVQGSELCFLNPMKAQLWFRCWCLSLQGKGLWTGVLLLTSLQAPVPAPDLQLRGWVWS